VGKGGNNHQYGFGGGLKRTWLYQGCKRKRNGEQPQRIFSGNPGHKNNATMKKGELRSEKSFEKTPAHVSVKSKRARSQKERER